MDKPRLYHPVVYENGQISIDYLPDPTGPFRPVEYPWYRQRPEDCVYLGTGTPALTTLTVYSHDNWEYSNKLDIASVATIRVRGIGESDKPLTLWGARGQVEVDVEWDYERLDLHRGCWLMDPDWFKAHGLLAYDDDPYGQTHGTAHCQRWGEWPGCWVGTLQHGGFPNQRVTNSNCHGMTRGLEAIAGKDHIIACDREGNPIYGQLLVLWFVDKTDIPYFVPPIDEPEPEPEPKPEPELPMKELLLDTAEMLRQQGTELISAAVKIERMAENEVHEE